MGERVVVGIEAVLVVVVAEVDRISVPGIVFINFPAVTITTNVMRIVIHLKNAVMLDNPSDFASHIGADYCRRKLGMVEWGKIVAKIMN